MQIIRIEEKQADTVNRFFIEQWGSSEMVVSSGVYNCAALDGFAALDEKGEIIGLITFDRKETEVEIISLDSLLEGQGIGSMLLERTEQLAQAENIKQITLLTTNDNLNALKFYQKRGYRLCLIFPNAVTDARKVKPSIPLIGEYGIPLQDELQLVKRL
ncbi:GNAT family N-acetyltransferase [Lysinibacillus odysseyi]|uniref:N-acetyltransferase domain-containing protein n=1 Tax=Lysinibacillus odysseyi 34hs-1 = NBRC 100172 TaxID=1220589 RepID=A0A0A3IFG2_9BACI|nr:GNAT family N-acetyltransferase [Lysinibacillus odysseyi]KGR82200.1 hypothetical protein CD32_23260 [Lysinibacillus odysseyi 34hs-1 = NBRC 100172]